MEIQLLQMIDLCCNDQCVGNDGNQKKTTTRRNLQKFTDNKIITCKKKYWNVLQGIKENVLETRVSSERLQSKIISYNK
ncbi:hypothetical protein DERP_009014 [Dermatophagoides pteronyssinus]|uniref:Uncharacterized protein n=1 Tax=Dermatophagoides pteronyssinus TaxID=6956 RepID=A0ABQ8JG63_DERPT|nr:hypothetical protein DERP_009014 [Dermatophagoides pteronyssinus]